MNKSRTHTLLLASVSLGLAISVSTAVPTVQAQSLLERLFKGPSAKNKQRRAGQSQISSKTRSKPKAVKRAVIKGHTYFTYKAKPLKSAGLATLASLSMPMAASGSDSGDDQNGGMAAGSSDFIAAAKYLEGFSLLADQSLSKAVIAQYKSKPEFIWVKDKQPTAAAEAVLEVLKDADSVGLKAQEYIITEVPADTSGLSEEARMEQLIKFELSLTMRALRYAQDARFGRIDPNKLSEYHYFPDRKINSAKMLEDMLSADDAAQYLASLSPQNEAFQALKAELAVSRNDTPVEDPIIIKAGTFIRPGNSNPELANVVRGIKRFGSAELVAKYQSLFESYDGSPDYNEPIVALVKDFQRENKLNAQGYIGRQTIGVIADRTPTNKVASILYSMERLRWHPSNFGSRYVFINTAAFRATYYNDSKEELSMDVIVGKRSNQTNFFYDEIERVVYNPYWGVPRTILVNVMLPKLRRDPAYFDKNGYEMTNRAGVRVASASVDWNSVGANFGYNVRQKPSSRNALGTLKILFPNKFVVYMHDTPARSLFNNVARAFSYGCIRLKRPQEMAAAVLGTTKEQVWARINKGKNATQNLKQKIPVYVAYFTAWPDAEGNVKYFKDHYGRDGYLKKAMDKTTAARGAAS